MPVASVNHSYFVVCIDYPARYQNGICVAPACREAVVDPEITRREVVCRLVTGEYQNIAFIHEIADWRVMDVTEELLAEANPDDVREADLIGDRWAARIDHARDLRKHEVA